MTVLVDPKTRKIVGQVLSSEPLPDGTVKVLTREGAKYLLPKYYLVRDIG